MTNKGDFTTTCGRFEPTMVDTITIRCDLDHPIERAVLIAQGFNRNEKCCNGVHLTIRAGSLTAEASLAKLVHGVNYPTAEPEVVQGALEEVINVVAKVLGESTLEAREVVGVTDRPGCGSAGRLRNRISALCQVHSRQGKRRPGEVHSLAEKPRALTVYNKGKSVTSRIYAKEFEQAFRGEVVTASGVVRHEVSLSGTALRRRFKRTRRIACADLPELLAKHGESILRAEFGHLLNMDIIENAIERQALRIKSEAARVDTYAIATIIKAETADGLRARLGVSRRTITRKLEQCRKLGIDA